MQISCKAYWLCLCWQDTVRSRPPSLISKHPCMYTDSSMKEVVLCMSREVVQCQEHLSSPGASHYPSTNQVTTLCCRKPPQIKFKLDFGKALGSAYTAKAVRLWLDPFLRETLADLIVWPNRIVVPILPEEVTGPLDDLMLRCASCHAHD